MQIYISCFHESQIWKYVPKTWYAHNLDQDEQFEQYVIQFEQYVKVID